MYAFCSVYIEGIVDETDSSLPDMHLLNGWLFVLSPPFFVDLTSFHPNQAMFVSDIVEC